MTVLRFEVVRAPKAIARSCDTLFGI
jgi:hypothetical protein